MNSKVSLLDPTQEPSIDQLAELTRMVSAQARDKADGAKQDLQRTLDKELEHARELFGTDANSTSSQQSPTLIVIAGPNGSGKTSFATMALEQGWFKGCAYINPDNIARDVFGDWNSREAVLKAATLADEQREACLRNRESLVFESVYSVTNKFDFVRRAKEAGYFVRLFVFCTDHPSINAARVAKRVMEGGHDVPIPKIISRYPKSIANCAATAAFADRAYVFDNSVDGFAPELVLTTKDGRTVKSCGRAHEWVNTIAKAIIN